MKTCKACLQELPLDAFYASSFTKDGRENKCRECRCGAMRERRKNGPPDGLTCYCGNPVPPSRRKYCSAECSDKFWYEQDLQNNSPRRMRARSAALALLKPPCANPACGARLPKKRYKFCSDACEARHNGRLYRIAKRDEINRQRRAKNGIYVQRRRARKQGAAVVEKISLAALYERDAGVCHICKKKVAWRDKSMDHLVPLSKGGDHSWVNVALAHRVCNSRRGVDRRPAQLRLVG